VSGIGSGSENPWIERENGTGIVIENGIFIVGDNMNYQWLYFFRCLARQAGRHMELLICMVYLYGIYEGVQVVLMAGMLAGWLV